MKKSLLAVLLSTALVLAACVDRSPAGVAIPTLASVPTEYAGRTNLLGADAAAAGADVFRTNCTPCHGESGHGDGSAAQALDPRPANLAELQQTAGDDFLFWRINTGVPGTSMVAWKGVLTEEQIWQVISYIRTLK